MPSPRVAFLGLGPPKAGTTWVGHMLAAHPRICMAEPKEVHYFNDSLSFNRSYSKSHYRLGEQWYHTHFAHCQGELIQGEITPRYLMDPVVPKRVYQYNPNMKFIICLRSPYERIVSHYHSARDYHHSEPRTISAAIKEEPEYVDACLYFKHLQAFLTYFPADRFHFVVMDDIRTAPEKVVSGLYTFLGVNSAFMPKHLEDKSNPARHTRSVRIRKITGALHRRLVASGLSSVVLFAKKIGVGKWINRMNSRSIEKVKLSLEDKQFIHDKTIDDLTALSRFLNRDLTPWLGLPGT